MTPISFDNNIHVEVRVTPIVDNSLTGMITGTFMDSGHKDFDWDELKRGSIIDISYLIHNYNPDRSYKYYKPDTSVVEHRTRLVDIGYSKGTAEEMARQACRLDAKRVVGLCNNDWCYLNYRAKINLYFKNQLNALNLTAYSMLVESDYIDGKIDALVEMWWDILADIKFFDIPGFDTIVEFDLLQGYLKELEPLDDIDVVKIRNEVGRVLCCNARHIAS